MKRTFTFGIIPFLFLLLSSCEQIDEDVVPMIGVYEAHVQGVAGPFSMNISADRGDDVFIEAPFNGFDWIVISADINNQSEELKEINIRKQDIGNLTIDGEGFYFQGSLQLNYYIDDGFQEIGYTIVGSRF